MFNLVLQFCIWCGIAFVVIMSLCMRWLYVVMLSGMCVTAWWLEPRACHFNVKYVEIAYRLQVMVASVHGGPQRGEGVPGAGGGAEIFVPQQRFLKLVPRQRFWNGRHNNVFWNWCHGNVFEMVAMTMFSEIAATAAIVRTTIYGAI
jgi:hypothetical protein